MPKSRVKKLKKAKSQNQRKLSLLKTQKMKALSHVINLKEVVRKPFVRSLDWIIIQRISSQ